MKGCHYSPALGIIRDRDHSIPFITNDAGLTLLLMLIEAVKAITLKPAVFHFLTPFLCFEAYGSYCVTGDECISMNLHNSICTQGVCQCRQGFFYPSEPMRTNCYEGSYIVAKCSGQQLSSSSVPIFRVLSE